MKEKYKIPLFPSFNVYFKFYLLHRAFWKVRCWQMCKDQLCRWVDRERTLIYSICQFSRCKHSYYSQFQTTNGLTVSLQYWHIFKLTPESRFKSAPQYHCFQATLVHSASLSSDGLCHHTVISTPHLPITTLYSDTVKAYLNFVLI